MKIKYEINKDRPFRAGERVICIDTTTDFDDCGHNGDAMWRKSLEVGKIYIIEDVDYNIMSSGAGGIRIDDLYHSPQAFKRP